MINQSVSGITIHSVPGMTDLSVSSSTVHYVSGMTDHSVSGVTDHSVSGMIDHSVSGMTDHSIFGMTVLSASQTFAALDRMVKDSKYQDQERSSTSSILYFPCQNSTILTVTQK